MDIVDNGNSVEIVQQNRGGPGRMASRALKIALALIAIAVFLLGLSVLILQRISTGEGPGEEIVGLFLFPPLALVFLAIAATELAIVLPRRLRIDAEGIHIRFSNWILPRSKLLRRQQGQEAHAIKRIQRNYATLPSGHIARRAIESEQFVIRYGGSRFGPVDWDQAPQLADAINAALKQTDPVLQKRKSSSIL